MQADINEILLHLMPVFLKYLLGYYLMRTLGEYILFVGRFAQEVTAYLIAGSYYKKSRGIKDETEDQE